MTRETQTQTYNGWTNYETWVVSLWLSNDSGTYDACREMCADGEAYEAGDRLKDFVEEMMPDLGASMFSDLLSGALAEVNWREIAEHFREE